MRTVKSIGPVARWLCMSALCAGCLNMDDISLGALDQDAAREGEPPEVAPDANVPPVMMATPEAGSVRDPREEMEREDEDERRALMQDAGSPADAAALPDASVSDAASGAAALVDAALDGGHDAGAEAGNDAALEEDSGPQDAGTDAQRSLLCTLEPWHCL